MYRVVSYFSSDNASSRSQKWGQFMAVRVTKARARKSRPTMALVGLSGAPGALPVPAAEVEAAAGYAIAEKATATRRAYKTDFAIFQAWCAQRGASALPAASATVAAFLAWEADR